MNLHPIFHSYMSPDDSGGGGGDAVDRGDDFLPTGDDADGGVKAEPETKKEPEAQVVEKAGDKADGKKEPEAKVDEAKDDDAEDDDAEKDPKKKAAPRIPVARHKEILERERAQRTVLEAELAQFKQGKQIAAINADLTAAETRVIEMEKSYAKLLTDGEVDKAAAVMSDIRRLEREMSESKSDMKIQAAEARATERARYNISLERVENAYPQLNPDHDDFSEELLTDVADLKTTYERKGLTPTAALQKAVAKLLGAETKKQEIATEVTPNVKQADVTAERKKDAVQKTLDAVAKSPPSTAKVGLDSDKAGGSMRAADVIKMSYKDFSALPEEALARMRGDVL